MPQQQGGQQRQKFPQLDFGLPPGRAVSGNFAVPSEKDYYGKDRDKPQFYFAVAVSKQDPRTGQVNQNIMGHAWHSYAGLQGGQGVQQAIQSAPIGARIPPDFRAPFAWKIEDGDAPENAQKEGWAGCWVYKFTSTFPIKCCDQNNNQIDPRVVQLGWFVEVSASCVINGIVGDTAGVYLNPSYVRVGVNSAPVIVPGKTAEQAFGAAPMQLPAGAGGYQPPQNQQAYAPPPPQSPQGNYPPPAHGAYAPPAAAGSTQPAGAPAYSPQSSPSSYAPPSQGQQAYAPPPQGAPNFQQPQSYTTDAYNAAAGGGTGAPAYAPASYAATTSPSDQGPVGNYTPPPMSAPPGAPAGAPAVPAYAPPAGAAPYTPPAGYPATASPSEQPPRELPQGVQPHPAFLNPANYGGQR